MPDWVKIGYIPVRFNAHPRQAKDFLYLRSETENPGNIVFPRRHPARILHAVVSCADRADPWVFELNRVRCGTYDSCPRICDEPCCAQCYLLSHFGLPARTTDYWDVLNTSLCPRSSCSARDILSYLRCLFVTA